MQSFYSAAGAAGLFEEQAFGSTSKIRHDVYADTLPKEQKICAVCGTAMVTIGHELIGNASK